jgi:hypothetical protein
MVTNTVSLLSVCIRSVFTPTAFSAFFALVSADLATFSAATFVAFPPSQASLVALSSASRADMRALAAAKATTIQKRKDSKKSEEDTRTSRSHKHTYLERLEQSPKTRRTQRQGREIFASKSVEQNYVRENQATKKRV